MQKLLFWGPVLTASGYGEHARQLLRALIASDRFDISVCSVKWGQTPFLTDSDEFIDKVRELSRKYELEQREGVKYDVSIQVTIPNEFKRMAPISIGVTAGIEVDRASPEWINKANENVDVVIVPSKHSAQTFAGVVYKNEKNEELALRRPLAICPEGFDKSVFNTDRTDVDSSWLDLEPEFNFVSVGLGLDHGMGEDRKNVSTLIKWFCETFKDDKRVGLVLKMSLVNNSLMDYEMCVSRISQIKQMTGCGEYPKIKLVHGRLSRKKLASLYKHPKVKAFVSLTHGEGFGLPMIEAAACGLPVMATNWSGHLDFLHMPDGRRKFVPVEYELKDIPDAVVWNGVLDKGTRWANPKEESAKSLMKKLFLSIDKPNEWARDLAASLSKTFDEETVGKHFVKAVDQIVSDVSAQNVSSGTRPNVDRETAKRRLYEQLQIPPMAKTLLYTMPMSAGDVFISTGVVSALKEKFPDHLVIFATDGKYSSILKDNPNIFRVIQFENWMTDISFCEAIFDEVYTPNLSVQLTTSNWVHGGKGRLLGKEFAAQCQVEFGDYFIKTESIIVPEKYIAFHPGSGKGQWEARNYRSWKKVLANLRKHTDMPIVQVGLEDDPSFEGCVDLRGKTTYQQLAHVIQNSSCLIGIDSVTMHMAAAFKTPHVALFGSSYSTSTGPVIPFHASVDRMFQSILLDAKNRCNGGKACYKYQCSVDRENPCINEIDPKLIVKNVVAILKGISCMTVSLALKNVVKSVDEKWDDCSPKIAGYTHVFNAETNGYPYIESIKSMLGFCDEVVVVDGGSNDGTVEKIKAIGDDRVKLFEREWDWNEPGMDGMQKAFGRAMVSVGSDDFLWQQDADEVVHEDDYAKIRKLVERFPSDVDLVHLPVIELWGSGVDVRTDRHSWKWRLSRNNFRVTHGINKDARVFDEKTGRTFAKKGQSDGCEYVDIMTNEYIQHKGFYNGRLELMRKASPLEYGTEMNRIFSDLPSVFHYSWADLPRKIRNFKTFWNKCWSNLYNESAPVDRFPGVQSDDDVVRLAGELKSRGGEHGSAKTFKLDRSNPTVMTGWLERIDSASGHLHNDDKPAGVASTDAAVVEAVDTTRSVQVDGRT